MTLDAHNKAGSIRCSIGSVEGDDHNNPAIIARAGKPLIVMYARHNLDNLLRIRKSTKDADTPLHRNRFTEELTIAFGEPITYCLAFVRDDDRIIALVRERDGPYWSLVISSDWGETWSTPTRFLTYGAGQYPYLTARQYGSTLRFAVGQHPNQSESPDAWYGEINLDTGAVTAEGTALGNLDGTSLPVEMTDLEQVTSLPAGERQWVFDVGEGPDPIVVTGSFDTSDVEATSIYRRHVRRGGAWASDDIASAGAMFSLHEPLTITSEAFRSTTTAACYSPASQTVSGLLSDTQGLMEVSPGPRRSFRPRISFKSARGQ